MNSSENPAARVPEKSASTCTTTPSAARPRPNDEYWKKLEAAGLTRPVPFHALIIAPWPFPPAKR